MLKLLGAIYYVLALLGLIAIFNGFTNHFGGISLVAGGGFVLASAFFGAICWVADDIRSLLRTLVNAAVPDPLVAAPIPPAPEAPAAPVRDAPAERVRKAAAALPETIDPDEREPEMEDVEPSLENASEDELMAAYDIIKPADHFLAYGRVPFETLGEAIDYVKATRR